ncbi:MAG: hypothetical protein OIF50_02995 [Flavobacteriaceae bacterium]|nr:hypothetical protein [Flavobacteriaceae bacterium]
MKNIFTILIACIFAGISHGQDVLNKYEYVVIPKKFSCFKTPNKYGSSTMISHLLRKQQFQTAYDDAIPPKAQSDRCTILWADLMDHSGVFKTKVQIQFKDCNNQIVYTTEIGSSKIKKYDKAYKEAIQKSMASLQFFNHQYTPSKKKKQSIRIDYTEDVKEVKEDVSVSPEAPIAPPTAKKPVSTIKDSDIVPLPLQLTAIAIGNSKYKVMDGNNKQRFLLQKGMMDDLYTVLSEDNKPTGVVYKQQNKWYMKAQTGSDIIYELQLQFQ